MTAVAAPYEDLYPAETPLTERLVEALDEEALAALLVLRFRSYLGLGYRQADALLLSVGFDEGDVAFVAEAASETPRRLQ